MLYDSLNKAINTITRGIEGYKSAAINESLPYFADLNIEQRLQGKRADGQFITPELRNETYAAAKLSKGGKAPFGTPDLKDTGDFNSGQFVKKQGKTLLFSSTDDKNSGLVKKYGEEIHGLSEESRQEALNDQLVPTVLYYIEQQLVKI